MGALKLTYNTARKDLETSPLFVVKGLESQAKGSGKYLKTYAYGFQGQERDDEVKGSGNSVNYKFRMHDARLGRFFSRDPLAPEYSYNSPYAFSENRVIDAVELEGAEKDLSIVHDPTLRNFSNKPKLMNAYREGQTKGAIIGLTATVAIMGGYVVMPYITEATLALSTNPSAQFATLEAVSFSVNALYEGADDPFPTPGPGGEAGKIAKRVFKGGPDMFKYLDEMATEIININKKYDVGKELHPLSSVFNSASYYEKVTDQGSAIFNSLITGHVLDNGVKRTASEFITTFAKENNLTLKLDAKGLQTLSTKLATPVKQGGVRYKTEELSSILFEEVKN